MSTVRTLTTMTEFEDGQRVKVTLRNQILPERSDSVIGTVTFTPRLGVVSENTGSRYSLLASEDNPSMGLSQHLLEAVLLTPEGTTLVPSPTDLSLGQAITVQHHNGAGKGMTITGHVTRNRDGSAHDRLSVTGTNVSVPTDGQRVWYLTPPEDESRWWDTISFVATPTESVPNETETLRQRVATLERLNSTQQNDLNRLLAEQGEFKARVGAEAMELAREHNWCEVVQNALTRLDIPVPTYRSEVYMTVTVKVTGTPSQREPGFEWVASSVLDEEHDDGALTLSMDSDWEDTTFEVMDKVVTSVEEVD